MAANDNSPDGDLLLGVKAISAHLGVTERQAWHFINETDFPTFKIGGKRAARKSTLAKYWARLERAAA